MWAHLTQMAIYWHGVWCKYFFRIVKQSMLHYVIIVALIHFSKLKFRLPGGSLGALQVDFKYLKKGQGSLVCKALTKQLGDYGRDIVACVSTDNQPANVLFKSFQFKEIGTAYFPRTLPFKPDFEWHDKTVQ